MQIVAISHAMYSGRKTDGPQDSKVRICGDASNFRPEMTFPFSCAINNVMWEGEGNFHHARYIIIFIIIIIFFFFLSIACVGLFCG